MTPDKNNFQFRNDGSKEAIEAIKLLGFSGVADWYGTVNGEADGWVKQRQYINVVTPSEALALLKPVTMLPEITMSNDDRAAELLLGIEFKDQDNMIEAIVRVSRLFDTAPQINLEEVEKLVRRSSRVDKYDRSTPFDAELIEIAEAELIRLRKLIGYTLDANGKPVAI